MLEDIQTWIIALAILVGAFVLSWFIGFLTTQLMRRYFSKTRTNLDDILIGGVKTPLRIAIVVAGIELALNQVDIISDSKLQEGIDSFFFVIYLLIIYVALIQLISAIAQWYGEDVVSKTETELDDKFLSFFKALANVVLTTIVIIILLGRFGIE